MASPTHGPLPTHTLAETRVATHWFHSTGDCIERLLRGLPLTPRCILDGHGHVDPTFVHTGIPSVWRRKKRTEFEERIETKYRDWLEAQIKIFSGLEVFVSISTTDPDKGLEIAIEQLRHTLQCFSLTRQANSIFLSAMRSAGFDYLADILSDRLARFDHHMRKELWRLMQHSPKHMMIPDFLLEFDIESESASSAISRDFPATPKDQDQDEDDCPICTCHVEMIQAAVPPQRYLEPQRGVMVWQLVQWAHMGDVLSGLSASETSSTRLGRLLRQESKSFVTKYHKIRRRACLYWTAFKTQSLLICSRTALLTRSLLSANAWGALLTSFRAYRLQGPTRPIFRETIHVPQQVVFCGTCKKRFHGECMSSWFASGGNNCPHCRTPMTRETFKAWLKLANTFCAVARRTSEGEYQEALREFRDF